MERSDTEQITARENEIICAKRAGKEGNDNIMQESACLTRKIGSTTYRVRIFCTGNETMEDKILRLIREESLDYGENCGIMTMPQMSREPERRAA